MPPGPTAPCSPAGLLAAFRPCFTAPTFQTFIGLVVGLIAQTRRRTVCGRLTGAGLDQVWHHSRAHRLFSNARWSADALGLIGPGRSDRGPTAPGRRRAHDRRRRHTLQTFREEGLRGGVASRRRREGPGQSPGHPEPAGELEHPRRRSVRNLTQMHRTSIPDATTRPTLDQRTVRHPPLTQRVRSFLTNIDHDPGQLVRSKPTNICGQRTLTWPCADKPTSCRVPYHIEQTGSV
jgi:hypothetical protein